MKCKKLELELTECNDDCSYFIEGCRVDMCSNYSNEKATDMKWAKGTKFPTTCPLEDVED